MSHILTKQNRIDLGRCKNVAIKKEELTSIRVRKTNRDRVNKLRRYLAVTDDRDISQDDVIEYLFEFYDKNGGKCISCG
jgi:hypothetical protein